MPTISNPELLLVGVFGGDEGDRTPDLCNAIAALSQLSYVPASKCRIQNEECKMNGT